MPDRIKLLVAVSVLLLISLIFFAGLGHALVPLMSAVILAYLFFPMILRLEKLKIPRQITVIAIFTILLLLLTLIILVGLPYLLTEAQQLLLQLPGYFKIVVTKLQPWADQYHIPINLQQDEVINYVANYLREYAKNLSFETLKTFSHLLGSAFSTLLGTIIAAINIFLFPMFFYYTIVNYEKMESSVISFIPQAWLGTLGSYYNEVNLVLSGFFRGQMIVAFIQSIIYSIGLTAIGLKFGLFVGIITGILSIIPYAGAFLGLVVSLLIAAATFTTWKLFLAVIVVFAIASAIESFVTTPKIVGDKAGLTPLATMLVLIIGGNLFGIVGMLFAIPCGGIVKIIIGDIKTWYQHTFFTNATIEE